MISCGFHILICMIEESEKRIKHYPLCITLDDVMISQKVGNKGKQKPANIIWQLQSQLL